MILNITGQLLGFAGSLCLLLFGMNMLSDGIQKGAGSGLQKLVAKITENRFYAVLTGIGVTALIQSSGATTVMVVSFVNAEILSLEQAIGVIFGANIGTTVTAWIVSFFGFNFSISAAAIPLFGLGYILKYFKKTKIHNFADCFMGFALLFMGLGLLKESLTLGPAAARIFTAISSFGIGGILLGILIGAIITALIHSSSAMTAIVLTMAANGTLSWELSAAIVLGSNIGSTIDAVMSSFGATTNAKRTAFVHVAFNVSGTVIALLIFKPFLTLIDFIVPEVPAENITIHIAMLHTIFNLCATLLFIPFVKQIADIARRFVPESDKEKDAHYHMPAIMPYSRMSADLYIYQIHAEVSKMAAKVMEMFDAICNSFFNPQISEEAKENVNQIENYIDEMNAGISDFLQKCSRLPNANSSDRHHFTKLIHITDALENLSDETCSLMHTAKKYITNKSYDLKDERTKEITDYLELLRIFFEQACTYFTMGINEKEKKNGQILEEKINENKHTLKKASRKRIESGADVKKELRYIDMVRKIERSGDCIWAIIQAL
ncbi:Na/Pi cotransporter family protein [Treponema sp.]|uniref:Na/Pi cotransporter family protein n=1 Tax=Treponema sp. TaxID=166 RepID=UPI0025F18B5A|nr:Na/Pi cotransporter family protein [Treponema sp.]MCR5217089.1 Na/Pi cotransporter family protein [Treponema sp.]